MIKYLQITNLHSTTIRCQQILTREFHTCDRRFIDVLQLQERTIVTNIKDFDFTLITTNSQLHSICTETKITHFTVKDLHALKTFTVSTVIALNLSLDVTDRQHLMHRCENDLIEFRAMSID